MPTEKVDSEAAEATNERANRPNRYEAIRFILFVESWT
jgi:hypothetical protein